MAFLQANCKYINGDISIHDFYGDFDLSGIPIKSDNIRGVSLGNISAFVIDKLTSVSSLILEGTLTTVSLPQLENAGQLEIETTNSTSIELPALTNASDVHLRGFERYL